MFLPKPRVVRSTLNPPKIELYCMVDPKHINIWVDLRKIILPADKGACIYYVRKFFMILDPSPFVRISYC